MKYSISQWEFWREGSSAWIEAEYDVEIRPVSPQRGKHAISLYRSNFSDTRTFTPNGMWAYQFLLVIGGWVCLLKILFGYMGAFQYLVRRIAVDAWEIGCQTPHLAEVVAYSTLTKGVRLYDCHHLRLLVVNLYTIHNRGRFKLLSWNLGLLKYWSAYWPITLLLMIEVEQPSMLKSGDDFITI